MAKRLSEAEWAKVRIDREVKGLSFHELADKYNVSSATVFRKAKTDGWKEPGEEPKSDGNDETKRNETSKRTVSKPNNTDKPKIKPDCLSDGEPDNETLSSQDDKTKRNETVNETTEDDKSFDVKGYVDSLKKSFDPSRARDRGYMAFQLSQIDEHLGDLSSVFESGNLGKYRPEFARIAYSIALLGGTPKSLAECLNVSEQTIHNWLNAYPEFNIAWIGGKDFADAKVVQALYKRAVGFKETVEDYKTERGELVPVEKTLVFPGDVQAQQFWLKNRQPHLWKDKVEVQEEITFAVTDKKAADEFYNSILVNAQDLKDKFHGRAERMNLTLDGDCEDAD